MASEMRTMPAAETANARDLQHGAVGPQARPRVRSPQRQQREERDQSDQPVEQERRPDALDRADRRPEDRPDRVRREHTGQPLVRGSRPELQDREGDADPESRRAQPLDAARGEPGTEPVSQHEARVPRQQEHERPDEDGRSAPASGGEARQRIADELAEREAGHERAGNSRAGAGPLADLRQHRGEHPVAGRVEHGQRQQRGVSQSSPPTSSTAVFRSVMSSIV